MARGHCSKPPRPTPGVALEPLGEILPVSLYCFGVSLPPRVKDLDGNGLTRSNHRTRVHLTERPAPKKGLLVILAGRLASKAFA